MIEALSQALFHPDTAYLALVVAVAGVVRGFAGFGGALIIVPLASRVLQPLEVLTLIMIIDVFSAAPLMPRAVRDSHMTELKFLILGMAVMLPIGLFLLTRIDPDLFRWQASTIAISLVVIMISGWRHSLVMGNKFLLFVGGCGGFLGGLTGIPGPPVILAYMTGKSAVARIRANIFLYLLAYDSLLGLLLLVQGAIALSISLTGALMLLPHSIGTIIGARLFNPAYDRLYRWVAYAIIIASAVGGLPVWE